MTPVRRQYEIFHDCWAAVFPFLSVYLHVAGIEAKYWLMKKAKTPDFLSVSDPGGYFLIRG